MLLPDAFPTQKLPFHNYKTKVNSQHKNLTDVCLPFANKLLNLQAAGVEISQHEFEVTLEEIYEEVKTRIIRKVNAGQFLDLCRGCLMSIECDTTLDVQLEDDITIAEELTKIVGENIKVGDKFPQKICNECLAKSPEDLKEDILDSINIIKDNFDEDMMMEEEEVRLKSFKFGNVILTNLSFSGSRI